MIIFISHILDEIFEICDRVTVLRDGAKVGVWNVNELTISNLIKYMIGKAIKEINNPSLTNKNNREVCLEVRNLTTTKKLINDVSFNAKYGEIIGISGLIGAGKTELLRSIFGIDKIENGEIIIQGKKMDIKSPKDAIKAGLSFLPEDRKEQGLVLIRSITENITMSAFSKISNRGFIYFKKERCLVEKILDDLSIKPKEPKREVITLSGGNQQKIIFGKWLASEPLLMLLDEPTRGMDVGAKVQIYEIIRDISNHGVTILISSSDTDELIAISDRILIMYEGRVIKCLTQKDINRKTILYYLLQGRG